MGEGAGGSGEGQFGATQAGVVGGAGQVEQDLVGPRNPQNPAQDNPHSSCEGAQGAGPTGAGRIKLGQKKIPAWTSHPSWNGLAWQEVEMEKLEARLLGGAGTCWPQSAREGELA